MTAAIARLLVVLIAVGLRRRLCFGRSPTPLAAAERRGRRTECGRLRVPRLEPGALVIVGRIVTMAEPSVAEALLIEDGTVTAVGTRDEVLALAGDQVPVMDIGRERRLPRVHRCPRPLDR